MSFHPLFLENAVVSCNYLMFQPTDHLQIYCKCQPSTQPLELSKAKGKKYLNLFVHLNLIQPKKIQSKSMEVISAIGLWRIILTKAVGDA